MNNVFFSRFERGATKYDTAVHERYKVSQKVALSPLKLSLDKESFIVPRKAWLRGTCSLRTIMSSNAKCMVVQTQRAKILLR